MQHWLARRRQLVDMLTAKQNRVQAAPRIIRPKIQAHIGEFAAAAQ